MLNKSFCRLLEQEFSLFLPEVKRVWVEAPRLEKMYDTFVSGLPVRRLRSSRGCFAANPCVVENAFRFQILKVQV